MEKWKTCTKSVVQLFCLILKCFSILPKLISQEKLNPLKRFSNETAYFVPYFIKFCGFFKITLLQKNTPFRNTIYCDNWFLQKPEHGLFNITKCTLNHRFNSILKYNQCFLKRHKQVQKLYKNRKVLVKLVIKILYMNKFVFYGALIMQRGKSYLL